MKIDEIRQLETADLLQQLEGKREEIFKLRLQWHAGSLENPNQIRLVRKDIARIMTIVRERELAAEVIQGEGNA
jgi:large subunit ribosomal protein L29